MSYTLILEGSMQIIAAITIFIMVKRRGKNRLLLALGWLFLGVGIFTLGHFIPLVVGSIPIIAGMAAYSSVVCHTSIFFGLSGYCSTQIEILRGRNAARIALAFGIAVALLLLAVHILSLGTQPIWGYDNAAILRFANQTMFFFFIAAMAYIAIIFFALSRHFKNEKIVARYSTITGTGIAFMLLSILIRKALDITESNIFVDLLSFFSFALVIVGAFIQTSHAMSPGSIYDAKTKKPVSMAIVRFMRVSDGKLLESRVTDAEGKYGIISEPGYYTMSVSATGYHFPAEHADGYHGEPLHISSTTLIGMDIPLDPQS